MHVDAPPSEALHQTVEGHLSRVGDVGEDGVLRIAPDGFQGGVGQLLAQLLALQVDVAVGTPAEVDSLERALEVPLRREDGLQSGLAVAVDDEGLPRLQLDDVFAGQVEGGLEHGTLAGQCHHLVVTVEEGRADAPRVADGKHLAASRQAAHHVAAVVGMHGRAQHVGHVHVVLNVAGDVESFQPQPSGRFEVALHLAVQPVPHQLQGDVGVAVDAGRLPCLCHLLEHFVNVRHVEVAAEAEVLGPPVVAAQERVYVGQPALARGGIAQVPHQQFARHRLADAREYLGDGILAFSLFAKHVLLARRCGEAHRGHSRTLLASIVLFLHHQVELVEPVGPRTVFLLIVCQRLQQPYHGYAAFVL